MKLRHKLALSYTIVFTVLLGITFIFIYYISKKDRLDEFHQSFKERALVSFRLIAEMKLIDDKIFEKLDKNTIGTIRKNSLLFDSSGAILYNSNGNIKPEYAALITKRLTGNEREIFTSDSSSDLLGLKFKDKNKTYIGVARADDKVGKKTTRFLALLLLSSFGITVSIILLLSFYLSGLITQPIRKLTKEIGNISPGKMSYRVSAVNEKNEVGFLANKFNEMLEKVENSFKFQHHFINHLSHELKTPLAVMMANAESALTDHETEQLKKSLQFQKDAVFELSNVINTIMDISKTELHQASIFMDSIRVDELLFECIDTISLLNSVARFDFNVDATIDKSETLIVHGNIRMLKIAFMNLLRNAINYSQRQFATIEVISSLGYVQVSIINDGLTINTEESGYLFKDLFRGNSSNNTKGLGLGLVLTNRIITLHQGVISYRVKEDGQNCFCIQLMYN